MDAILVEGRFDISDVETRSVRKKIDDMTTDQA